MEWDLEPAEAAEFADVLAAAEPMELEDDGDPELLDELLLCPEDEAAILLDLGATPPEEPARVRRTSQPSRGGKSINLDVMPLQQRVELRKARRRTPRPSGKAPRADPETQPLPVDPAPPPIPTEEGRRRSISREGRRAKRRASPRRDRRTESRDRGRHPTPATPAATTTTRPRDRSSDASRGSEGRGGGRGPAVAQGPTRGSTTEGGAAPVVKEEEGAERRGARDLGAWLRATVRAATGRTRTAAVQASPATCDAATSCDVEGRPETWDAATSTGPEEEAEERRRGGAPHGRMPAGCPVCGAVVRELAPHVRRAHLPWFWVPDFACWACEAGQGDRRQVGRHLRRCPDAQRALFVSSQEDLWARLMAGALHRLACDWGAVCLPDLKRKLQRRGLLPPVGARILEGSAPRLLRRWMGGEGPPSLVFRGLGGEPEEVVDWGLIARALAPLSQEARARFREWGRGSTRETASGELPTTAEASIILRRLGGVSAAEVPDE